MCDGGALVRHKTTSQPHHISYVTNLIVSILYATGDWCEINCKRLCALLISSKGSFHYQKIIEDVFTGDEFDGRILFIKIL